MFFLSIFFVNFFLQRKLYESFFFFRLLLNVQVILLKCWFINELWWIIKRKIKYLDEFICFADNFELVCILVKLLIQILEELHVAMKQRSSFFSNGTCECEIIFAQNKKCFCLVEWPQFLFNLKEECAVVSIRIEWLALPFGEFSLPFP